MPVTSLPAAREAAAARAAWAAASPRAATPACHPHPCTAFRSAVSMFCFQECPVLRAATAAAGCARLAASCQFCPRHLGESLGDMGHGYAMSAGLGRAPPLPIGQRPWRSPPAAGARPLRSPLAARLHASRSSGSVMLGRCSSRASK